MTLEQIAELCHETVRTHARICGHFEDKEWSKLPITMQAQIMEAVKRCTEKLGQTRDPAAAGIGIHNMQMAQMLKAGWRYGDRYDAEAKESPSLLPFDELDADRQNEAFLFAQTVALMQRTRKG